MSKDEIHKICEKYYIKNYIINNDLSIDVNGNIDLDRKKLTELPLSFNVIKGNFVCSSNYLNTLKGSPNTVDGDFLCNNNNLTTLEHSPQIVTGLYACSFNKLKSLKGCPTFINNDFICDRTSIKSFDGAPQYIKYNFSCAANNIRTLRNCPKYGETIDLTNNPIHQIFKLFIKQDKIMGVIMPGMSLKKERELIEYFNELDVIQKRGRATVVVLDRLNYFLQDIGKPEVDGSKIKKMKVLY